MSYTIEKTYVYKCDRCGTVESVPDPKDPSIHKRPGGWEGLSHGVRTLDLCAPCNLLFLQWMERGVSPSGIVPNPKPGEPGSLTINDAKSSPFTINNPVQFRYPEEQS